MPRIWKPLPKEFPADGATVWVTPSNQYNPPFLATFNAATFEFTDILSAAIMPWWAVARWKPAALAPAITDSFAGTGFLSAHLSNQGFPWIGISGSLSLDGSGLTTDVAGAGLSYLDDATYATIPPPTTQLQLNVPTVPTPIESLEIWLFAFAEPATDADGENYLGIRITYTFGVGWAWLAQSSSHSGPGDFALGSLTGPPSVISILPAAQEFRADATVLVTGLTDPPNWSANSRPGIKLSYVTGVNCHATFFGAPI